MNALNQTQSGHFLISPQPKGAQNVIEEVTAVTLQRTISSFDDEPFEDTQLSPEQQHYEHDVVHIIEEGLDSPLQLLHDLGHISTALDQLTQQIMNLDNALDTIALNALTGSPLLHCSMCIFLKFGFGNELDIDPHKFCRFIQRIESSYHCSNPYHNRMHATEVMMATMMLLVCG